ncbi:MAG: GNAT family N-acetyltransferase [Leptolyngbyaceae bacterium]|nr:GNAT family N-acetyltransferase [Leptolyngbyaceae bacterium]
MVESLVIRHASPNEVEAIALLSTRTFWDAFGADNDPADMEEYVRSAFSIERMQAELSNPNHTFLLAFGGQSPNPIGYAKLKSGAQTIKDDAHSIEIERLYVDKPAIGQGVGAALMNACLNEAAMLGYRTVVLGVWKRNERAIAFYQRWGFEPVGERVFMLGADRQNDLILQRSLLT